MTLNPHASYSHTHAYVVKLRRDSDPARGHLVGRIEHVDSGRSRPFNSAEELIAALLSDLASVQSATPESGS
jgi:hypothetical protein